MMRIFALSDLHFSFACDKPMDLFGGQWENHAARCIQNWKEMVTEDDVVLVAGDISWAMSLNDAKADLDAIGELPGRKVLIKGNHDYWHGSLAKTREILHPSITFLQNDAIRIGEYTFFGSRGWKRPSDQDFTPEDAKIYKREAGRIEMSAAAAQKLGGTLVGMTHYPPGEEIEAIFAKAGARAVIYGHLHGAVLGTRQHDYRKDGVDYYLTSCDYLGCVPREICIETE